MERVESVAKATPGLDHQVEQWVRAGIVTEEQGARILEYAARATPVAEPVRTAAPARRLTPIAELVSYLGVVLVLASGALAVSRLWQSFGVGGRVAVGAVVSLLGFVGGTAISRLGDEGTTRLGWFFWLCGTGGVAMFTAVLVDRLSSHSAGGTMVVTGVAVLAVSVGLWRNLDRPLQFLSGVAGLTVVVAGVGNLTNWHVSPSVAGASLWCAGLVLGYLSIRLLHPSVMVTLVAQGAVFTGAMAMATDNRGIGMVLGAITAAGGVAFGEWRHEPPVVVVGVVSFFAFLIRLLSFYLRGPATLLVAFAIGVALVGVVVWRVAHHPSTPDGAAPRGRHRWPLVHH
ncbi:MAG: DUF2157 domain-containing protein [Acidobacteriota bacterium]|nr:DUF2157 domain-containing protein [Acidobacteriota bacterium]